MDAARLEGRPRVRTPVGVRPGGEEAAGLVRRFGSPLFVYDAAEIARCYRRFVAAFPYEPLECHYAVVCNKNPEVIRILAALGAGIHANTPGDAFAALEAGVSSRRIVYSGTNLNAADLEYLLGLGIPLNLDSLDQVRDLAERGPGRSFGVRLLVDPSSRRNRIGLDADELARALRLASRSGLRLVGLHVYVGTNTLRATRFLKALDEIAATSELLPDLEYIDLGGGYGLRYRPSEPELDVRAVGRSVADCLHRLSARRGRPIRLLLEPGRILVGSSGTLLATVVSVKERGGRRYVGVDTTVGNIAVPSVYHGYHRVEALDAGGAADDVPTDVCGNTTHSGDFLGRDLRLQRLVPGDLLALRDVGAYAYAMSSHFLNRPRAAEVVLRGHDAVLTTRRETLSDLVSLSVPGRP